MISTIRWRVIFSLIIAATVGVGIWGIFIYRSAVYDQRDQQLCGVIAAIIQQSDQSAGTPVATGYEYYQARPHELALVHAYNRYILDQLPCKPIVLPEGK